MAGNGPFVISPFFANKGMMMGGGGCDDGKSWELGVFLDLAERANARSGGILFWPFEGGYIRWLLHPGNTDIRIATLLSTSNTVSV